jgi:SAM-dependent methyltransferase
VASSEWTKTEHVDRYLAHAATFPHRAEGERVLLDHVPLAAGRILDLGSGDGRLLALLRAERPESMGVAVDVSEPMLERARQRFAGAPVEFIRHDLAEPLPDLGPFDSVVSSFAIHHVEDERKRSIYAEIFELLEPSGIFANLEHVASPTQRLHQRFYKALDYPSDWEDTSNRLVDVETQLRWLREVGFEDVDCYWKWLEMALLIGVKPER